MNLEIANAINALAQRLLSAGYNNAAIVLLTVTGDLRMGRDASEPLADLAQKLSQRALDEIQTRRSLLN